MLLLISFAVINTRIAKYELGGLALITTDFNFNQQIVDFLCAAYVN